MTGGSKEDIFIFESSLAANGTDTILDFQVKPKKGDKAKDNDPDILDLRLAIGKDVKIKDSSIDKYVWVVGENLYVDPTGKGVASTPWAILKGVKDGDELRVRAGSFDGWITAKKNQGDTTPPVFDPNTNYIYSYDENQVINAVVATVLGASDDSGSVTQYRFSNGSATSADGYFVIDAQGKIKITEAGWGAAVNDYEAGPPNYDYCMQAGDAAGNWSVSQKITLSLNDLGSGSGSNIYLSLDRDGLWFDTD